MTVIVLSNSDRTSAGQAGIDLARIVFGAPYKLPTARLRDTLWDVIAHKGVGTGIQQYRDLKRTHADKYDFGEESLLDLGYDLFEGRKLAEALEIFSLNLEIFPRSAYSYDGLADVAAAQGKKTEAIAYFEKSLTLDPENQYAVDGLGRLRKDSAS